MSSDSPLPPTAAQRAAQIGANHTLHSRRPTRFLCFTIMAFGISAAKIVLYSGSAALFLTHHGAEGLPWFYLLFAPIAITLSFIFSRFVDNLPRAYLFNRIVILMFICTLILHIIGLQDIWSFSFLILISAHIYEIISDIIFWLMVTDYFSAIDIRRKTVYFHMSFAAGGTLGGIIVSMSSRIINIEYFLLIVACLFLFIFLVSSSIRNRFDIIDDYDENNEENEAALSLHFIFDIVKKQPLIILLAINTMLMTTIYCVCEFMYLKIYHQQFPDEADLAGFLAVILACIQALEFILLYFVGKPLIERTGPVTRNGAFPLTSLLCLGGLALDQKLPVAIAAHINAEAVSNAIFEPVTNTNYSCLPVEIHGRVRTLADGIFYPAGMALGALMLLGSGESHAWELSLMAILFALISCTVAFGIGASFMPTMHMMLRRRMPPPPNAAITNPAASPQRRAGTVLVPPDDLAVLIEHLSSEVPCFVDSAIHTLGRIGSRKARRALCRFLRPWHQRAVRDQQLLSLLPATRDQLAWAPFETAVTDSGLRTVDRVLFVVGALGADEWVMDIQGSLSAPDVRTRAAAIDALATLPYRRFIAPILPLLERIFVMSEPADRPNPLTAKDLAILAVSLKGTQDAASRWIRLGAICTLSKLGQYELAARAANCAIARLPTPQ